MALLVHVMILAVTSTGGVIAWLVLRGRKPQAVTTSGTAEAAEASQASQAAGAPQG